MELIKTIAALDDRISERGKHGKKVGFVPTMGALHEGHLSLVEKAGEECDLVVVSIFVNPTQFNDSGDLDRYPRDLKRDLMLLERTPCEIVFAPSVEEIYPEPDTRVFDFGQLDKVMEGRHRPGHFNGVAQVVSRLLDIVKPHKAYFGQKDFQQLAIVREMVRQLNIGTDIVAGSIVREPDGLAMSSRNLLLSEEQRKSAPLIAKTLFESYKFAKSKSVQEIRRFVKEQINLNPDLDVEYFEIVNGYTLQPVDNWKESDYIVGCIAVYAGRIRLIDNVVYQFCRDETNMEL